MKHLTLILILLFAFAAPLYPQSAGKVKTLVIDPGHGGKDPGAVGKTNKEKDIALSIALKLGNYIETKCAGVKVIYTRKTDVFVTLNKRAEIANNAKADLFISVHINSSPNKTAYGTSSHIYGFNFNSAMKSLSIQENSVVELEDDYLLNYGDWKDELSEIRAESSMALCSTPTTNNGKLLAEKIQKEFETRAKRTNRGVEYASFLVLKKTTMPSILVECGFISNEEEEKFLATDNGQSIIASAIFRAFRDYNGGNAPVKKDVYFRIQLKSMSHKIPLNSPDFKGITGVEEIYLDGAYKYVVGKETDYDKMASKLKEIRKKFPDAFIIAIQDGKKKISVEEAKKILK